MRRYRLTEYAAFTLVELLAAMVVLAMLMTIIFGIFNQASKAWLLAENRTENFQGARSALDMMTRELEGAIVATNSLGGSGRSLTLATFEDFGPATILGSSVTYIKSYASLQATPPNDAIFFVTQAGDSKANPYTDLAECGYYIGFPNPNVAGMKSGYYYLMRHYVRSHTLSGGAVAAYDIFQPANSLNWWSTSGSSAEQDQPILDNAIRFEVWYEYADPHNASATNGTRIADAWDLSLSGPKPTLPTSIPDPSVRLPRAFHLRLCVLDRRYAARMAVIMNGLPAGWRNGTMNGELDRIPYKFQSTLPISNAALNQTFKEGLRTFFRTVYPRNAS